MSDTFALTALDGVLGQAGNPITCLTVLIMNRGRKMEETLYEMTMRVIDASIRRNSRAWVRWYCGLIKRVNNGVRFE